MELDGLIDKHIIPLGSLTCWKSGKKQDEWEHFVCYLDIVRNKGPLIIYDLGQNEISFSERYVHGQLSIRGGKILT